MRASGEIGKRFLLAKISSFTVYADIAVHAHSYLSYWLATGYICSMSSSWGLLHASHDICITPEIAQGNFKTRPIPSQRVHEVWERDYSGTSKQRTHRGQDSCLL